MVGLLKITGLLELAVCESLHEKPHVKTLEEQLHRGQIEEVILQAENKLSLGRKMVRWKSQESLVEEPPVNQWKWLT
nr:PREDICTED: NADH dehydrogenase [ubiquinone] 1 alpha subcomplex subunit 5-like [Bos mutus]